MSDESAGRGPGTGGEPDGPSSGDGPADGRGDGGRVTGSSSGDPDDAVAESSSRAPGDAGVTRAEGAGRARDVVVPIAMYKRVTAYATLTAVVAVVSGFVMLDAATLQVSLTRRLLLGVLGAAGVSPPETLTTALFSLLGLGLIGFGAGVYVLGSRFRAEGMGAENGNAQDDDPEL